MPRSYRPLAVVALVMILGALPAAAAPGGAARTEGFSPLSWLGDLWASVFISWQENGYTPRPHPDLKTLESETGIGIDPAGQPLAVSRPEGTGLPAPAQH